MEKFLLERQKGGRDHLIEVAASLAFSFTFDQITSTKVT